MVKIEHSIVVRIAIVVALLALAAGITSALPRAAYAQPAAPPAPTQAAKDEAKARFDRSQELFAEGSYEQALIEIQRAYELAPSYKLLYNTAQIYAQLGNFAGALTTFERYLKDGGNELPAKRKAEVQKEIESLKARTATVTIKSNQENIELLVDGKPMTFTAGAPLLVNSGVRKFEARKPSFQAVEKSVTLAGGDVIELQFDLAEAAPPTPVITPRERIQPVDKTVQERSYVWVGWVATSVLAAGAIGTGVAAFLAKGDLEDEIGSPAGEGQTAAAKADAIQSAEDKRFALSVTTDVLIGAAGVAGAISLGFTIAWAVGGSSPDKAAAPPVMVVATPKGVSVAGAW